MTQVIQYNIIQFVHSHALNMSRLDFWWGLSLLCGYEGEEKGVVHFSPPAWCLNSAKRMWQWDPWAATDSLGLAVWPCMRVCLRVRLHVPPCLCADKRKEVEHIWDDSWALLTQGRESSDCYTHTGTGHCAGYFTATFIMYGKSKMKDIKQSSGRS